MISVTVHRDTDEKCLAGRQRWQQNSARNASRRIPVVLAITTTKVNAPRRPTPMRCRNRPPKHQETPKTSLQKAKGVLPPNPHVQILAACARRFLLRAHLFRILHCRRRQSCFPNWSILNWTEKILSHPAVLSKHWSGKNLLSTRRWLIRHSQCWRGSSDTEGSPITAVS